MEEARADLPDLCDGIDLARLADDMSRVLEPLHAADEVVAVSLRPTFRPRIDRR